MPAGAFDAFNAELAALKDGLSSTRGKTLRDEDLVDRFRSLFRTWTSIVKPTVEPFLKDERNFFKLEAEIDALARLTTKYKPVLEYRKRLNRIIELSNHLALYLPPSKTEIKSSPIIIRGELFLPEIPDLPVHLVPNSIIGWKSKIQEFISKFSFDKSIFIMIRYRNKNRNLIKALKSALSENGYTGIIASEHNLTNDLYNPIACLLACSKGIAIFDAAESKQEFNPNVAYELGMLHLLGRDCLILKHNSLKALHSDILMKLYSEYNGIRTLEEIVIAWIESLSEK